MDRKIRIRLQKITRRIERWLEGSPLCRPIHTVLVCECITPEMSFGTPRITQKKPMARAANGHLLRIHSRRPGPDHDPAAAGSLLCDRQGFVGRHLKSARNHVDKNGRDRKAN